jgi:hypothetical protein
VCSYVEDFERHTIDSNQRSERLIPLERHRFNSGHNSRARKTMSSILTTGIVAPNFTLNPGADGILDALEHLSDKANAHAQLANADQQK